MDRRIVWMLTMFVSLLAGGALAVAVFFASPRTLQHLDALPWWTGPTIGLALAIPVSGVVIAVVRRRRRRR